MIGYMHYNRFGITGFTDSGRGRSTPGVQTCPVCLLRFDAAGGALPDGTLLAHGDWINEVCLTIKDATVNGGYQAGCLAQAYPPF
ncbi:MAG: hypothetical protein ABIQ03_10330 [Burkholderiales bacterium]